MRERIAWLLVAILTALLLIGAGPGRYRGEAVTFARGYYAACVGIIQVYEYHEAAVPHCRTLVRRAHQFNYWARETWPGWEWPVKRDKETSM